MDTGAKERSEVGWPLLWAMKEGQLPGREAISRHLDLVPDSGAPDWGGPTKLVLRAQQAGSGRAFGPLTRRLGASHPHFLPELDHGGPDDGKPQRSSEQGGGSAS